MSGALKAVGGALGLNKSNSPTYQSHDMDTAMKTGNVGVQSDLGNVSMIKNPDGSWSKSYTSSDNDVARNSAMSNILSGLGQTGGADVFYQNAAKKLNTQFDRDQSALDNNLTNRGIAVGNEQYSRAMGDFGDKKNEALQNLAADSIFKGQELDAAKIANANSLAAGRDIGALAGMGAQNNYYGDSLSQANAAASAQAAANAQQGNSLLSTLGSGASLAAALLSDERAKENLIPVGVLDNGLVVYLGNYKKETGLPTTPQLFLIAQEVLEVFPDAVSESDGFLQVDYEKATRLK